MPNLRGTESFELIFLEKSSKIHSGFSNSRFCCDIENLEGMGCFILKRRIIQNRGTVLALKMAEWGSSGLCVFHCLNPVVQVS
jgi:hypothetical protein